jgi:small redox-active disulfide protein 2
MVKIQVLGTGCKKCATVQSNAETAARELGIEAEVEKIEDINKIVEFGVMSTPALAVDGKVKFVGKIPSAEEIKGVLSV